MPAAQDQQPNLLYIQSDQHNPAVIGCYGDPLVQTPNLDRLAERGVVLDHVYCPSPLCGPSRMSMLSGRYPHENRVWTNEDTMDSGIPTLAHAMGAAGYEPVLVGRLHSLGLDQKRGYARRLVGAHHPDYNDGRPVDHGVLSGTAGPARVSLQKSGPGQSAYQVMDEYVTASTIDHLNQLGVNKRAGQPAEPFSLSVGLMLPHQPFVARGSDYDLYRDKVPMPQTPAPFSEALHPHFRRWRQQCGIETVTEEEILRSRTAYWALVTRMDIMIGQILEALKRNDLDQNTLIVYISDHGEQVGEHGLWWKQTFYEDSVKVPGILSWPGVLPEGVHCDRVCSSLDINATMLEALGAPALPHSRGRSLLDVLHHPDTAAWDDTAFSEYCTHDGCFHRMIRCGAWKLNYYHGQEPQLFNLEEDPREVHDRARDPDCQNVRRELEAQVLDGWDPERIAVQMAANREDRKLITSWVKNVRPPDQFRWELRPEMDYLDDPAD